MEIAAQASRRWVDNLRRVRALSPATITAYSSAVDRFIGDHNAASVQDLCTQSRVTDWLVGIMESADEGAEARRSNRRSMRLHLAALNSFIEYCLVNEWLSATPVADMHRKAVRSVSGEHIPTGVPTRGEVECVLESVDVSTPAGVRDRALLEILYGTGARVSEIAALKTHQVDRAGASLTLIGKGGKTRIVPLGGPALQWLDAYRDSARGELLKAARSDTLFLSRKGEPMTRQAIWQRVRKYARAAGIQGKMSPHTFRHAYATHMVEGNAELRALQTLLGHSSVRTTSIYTSVAAQKIEDIHNRFHPRGLRSNAGS